MIAAGINPHIVKSGTHPEGGEEQKRIFQEWSRSMTRPCLHMHASDDMMKRFGRRRKQKYLDIAPRAVGLQQLRETLAEFRL